MNTTLRERIEGIRERLGNRLEILKVYIEDYSLQGDFENAMKNQIKYDVLEMVYLDICRELNK